ENFGYRQRTVWWRLKAFWSVFRQKQVWGEMVRKGFESSGKQVAEPAKARRTDAQRRTGGQAHRYQPDTPHLCTASQTDPPGERGRGVYKPPASVVYHHLPR